MRKRMMYLVLLTSFCTFSMGGCGSSFWRNAWRGFGESIGAVPAAFLVNFLGTTLGINFQTGETV